MSNQDTPSAQLRDYFNRKYRLTPYNAFRLATCDPWFYLQMMRVLGSDCRPNWDDKYDELLRVLQRRFEKHPRLNFDGEKGRLETWLVIKLNGAHLEAIRNTGRRPVTKSLPLEAVGDVTGRETDPVSQERLRIGIRNAMARLEGQQKIVMSRRLAGQTRDQIVAATGLTLHAVRRAEQDAIERIRELLSHEVRPSKA